MTLVATVLALAIPHHTTCNTHACNDRVDAKAREAMDYRLRHRCNHSTVWCVRRAAFLHRVSAPMLLGRAFCESRMNPYAVNPSSGAAGLFQFIPSTYATTPYARRGSIFSPKWNSLAAAWMVRVGRSGEWACA